MRIGIFLFLCFVFGCMVFGGCDRDDDYYDLNTKNGTPLADVIKFSGISSVSVLADSMSFSIIRVQVTQNADSVNRSVVLQTDLGKFPNNDSIITLPVNALGDASTKLVSDTPGTALIRATVKNIPIDTSI